ncbi:hypothetical protein LDENG_00045290, partial [Lucifuga dentata]
ESLDGACIISALKLRTAKESSAAQPTKQTKTDSAGENCLKECCVRLKRVDLPEPLRPRPVRKNRGLRMKRILLEEKRGECEEILPKYKSVSRETAPCSRTPSEVSDNEDLTCSSKNISCNAPYCNGSDDESWSYYSDEENFKSPAGSCSEDDSAYNCSDEHPSHVASVENKKLSATVRAQNTSQITGKTVIIQKRGNRCCICSEKVETSMTHHMKIHFPNDDYVCPRCDARFKALSSLRLHLKRTCYESNQQQVDPEKPEEAQNLYKCDECEKAFRYKLSLEAHKRTHDQLYCEVCRKVLRDAAMLARHKASHTPFQCTLCDKSFRLFKPLRRHYENIHKVSRPFKCNHCPKSFSKLNFFIVHEWKHTGYLPFQCQHCSMRFKIDAELLSHQRVHTREKPYLCSECGKAFSQRPNLLRHLNVIHSESRNDRKYSCSECEKAYKEKGALKKHQRRQHFKELLRHPCQYCGKMLSESAMARHKLIHTGEKPYKCTASGCDKSFRTTTEVKKHFMAHHSAERPFKCDACGKGFILRCLLNAHLKTHSGEKPFVCHVCDKAFPKLYSLNRHKKLVHASGTA